MTEQKIIEQLNLIFMRQGYSVIGIRNGFELGNTTTTFILPFEVAERIVNLYSDAESYWNSSDC